MPRNGLAPDGRLPERFGLRLRLPLLMVLTIVSALATFLWFANHAVEEALVRSGGERAQSAADRLAVLFEASTQQVADQLSALAAHPDVVSLLEHPSKATREAAETRLRSKLTTAGSKRVALWSLGSEPVLDLWLPGTGPALNHKMLPATPAPKQPGLSELQALDDKVAYSDRVVEVLSSEGPPADGGHASPIGYLTVRSAIEVNPPGVINQLVGPDLRVMFGGTTGGVWTDLSRVVPAPRVDTTSPGVRDYTSSGGEARLGAIAPIRNTPWALWVDSPRDLIIAPVRQFTTRMIGLGLGFIFVAAAIVMVTTARITTPLHELSVAADQLAAGDYSRRVTANRRDEIGQLGRAFNSMAGDIRSAYLALKEHHDHTQFALAAAHMGIWEIDLQTERVVWSDTLAPIFGLTPDLAPRTTKDFFGLVDLKDRDAAVEKMNVAVANRREDFTLDFRVAWPDGSVHRLDIRARVLYRGDGVATRVLGVAIDVTERHLLEAQLRQSQRLDAIGQLAGGVAHDFNNLLTAILGFASLLGDGAHSQAVIAEYVDEIRKAGLRGAGLTRQLLAFGRQQVLEPRVLDLNGLVRETGEMLRRLIGEHIELVTMLAPNLAPVLADRSQLEQIIVNLAVNARDAMPSGGRLSIQTANVDLDDSYVLEHVVVRPGPYVMLAVSDSGIGMDEETKRRIFDPFFTTKERGKGTGLGLATVYGIIKQSEGYIWVYSEKGRGAAFKIYLPRAVGAAGHLSAALRRPEVAVGSERLLVVEDESAVRLLSRVILQRAGYNVIEAATPEEAETLVIDGFDLLLSDVIMPGSTGPALFNKLKLRHPSLKVLFMSGYTDDMIMTQGDVAPGTAFLQKPFTPDRLLRKVREVLDV